MKIGANGASNIAAAIGLAIVCRTKSRSRIAWPLAGPPTVIIRCRISGAIRVSRRMLARTNSRDRTASRALSVSKATTNAMVMNSKVVLPPVETTRS